MHSMIYNTRSGHVLMGGMQNKLVELDLTKVKEIRVCNFKCLVCAVASGSLIADTVALL